MYSTTSLQIAAQKQNGIRTTETEGDCGVPIKHVAYQDFFCDREREALGKNIDRAGCSWLAQYFMVTRYTRGQKKGGREMGDAFQYVAALAFI